MWVLNFPATFGFFRALISIKIIHAVIPIRKLNHDGPILSVIRQPYKRKKKEIFFLC